MSEVKGASENEREQLEALLNVLENELEGQKNDWDELIVNVDGIKAAFNNFHKKWKESKNRSEHVDFALQFEKVLKHKNLPKTHQLLGLILVLEDEVEIQSKSRSPNYEKIIELSENIEKLEVAKFKPLKGRYDVALNKIDKKLELYKASVKAIKLKRQSLLEMLSGLEKEISKQMDKEIEERNYNDVKSLLEQFTASVDAEGDTYNDLSSRLIDILKNDEYFMRIWLKGMVSELNTELKAQLEIGERSAKDYRKANSIFDHFLEVWNDLGEERDKYKEIGAEFIKNLNKAEVLQMTPISVLKNDPELNGTIKAKKSKFRKKGLVALIPYNFADDAIEIEGANTFKRKFISEAVTRESLVFHFNPDKWDKRKEEDYQYKAEYNGAIKLSDEAASSKNYPRLQRFTLLACGSAAAPKPKAAEPKVEAPLAERPIERKDSVVPPAAAPADGTVEASGAKISKKPKVKTAKKTADAPSYIVRLSKEKADKLKLLNLGVGKDATPLEDMKELGKIINKDINKALDDPKTRKKVFISFQDETGKLSIFSFQKIDKRIMVKKIDEIPKAEIKETKKEVKSKFDTTMAWPTKEDIDETKEIKYDKDDSILRVHKAIFTETGGLLTANNSPNVYMKLFKEGKIPEAEKRAIKDMLGLKVQVQERVVPADREVPMPADESSLASIVFHNINSQRRNQGKAPVDVKGYLIPYTVAQPEVAKDFAPSYMVPSVSKDEKRQFPKGTYATVLKLSGGPKKTVVPERPQSPRSRPDSSS